VRPVPRASENFLIELFKSPLDPGYADAARRKSERPAPPRWRRLGGRGVTAFACLLIGLLFAAAYQHAVAAEPSTTKAREDLIGDVQSRRTQAEQLQRQAEDLRDQVAKARDDALADRGDAQRMRDLAAGTGLGKVTGDGVVATLADAPPQIDPVTGKPSDDNPGVVLDRDLQDVANALWQAGAEAIAINGQRLTATSTIRTAGGAILVDFRPVTGPYEIAAIGTEQDAFAGSATAVRFRRYVDTYRMQFTVKSRKGLTLAAASDPDLRYARIPSPAPSSSPSGGR
jgi:uncharacterized protein YlxW (UPF0749 family)